jgi:cardiolipin synthase
VQLLHYFLIAGAIAIAAAASCHVVLHKRDVRAAIGWVGLIWLAPVVGSILYAVFGVNRILRRAQALRPRNQDAGAATADAPLAGAAAVEGTPEMAHLAALARLVEGVVRLPLLGGNRVVPLIDGDEAYPAMLAAIDGARRSVALCTYIFDRDRIGKQFLEALARARGRGVAVRVLCDAVGAVYSFPSMIRALTRAGVAAARFMPTLAPTFVRFSNLRNHRKLLVVDGAVGFTGGMNLREGHCLGLKPRRPVRDIHFRVEGPVVAQLQTVFVEDWAFATGEVLDGDDWFPEIGPRGSALARGIPDGPDEDLDKLRKAILGAIACARSTLHVVTPYFLPDAALVTALDVAAMRGVDVRILLPGRSNIPLVHWAMMAQLWQVLEAGCRVWLSPPPFDHSKVLLVDGAYASFGSVNWDPRSLRLNFEFNVECYDRALAARLTDLVRDRMAASREITFSEIDARALPLRIRDGFARLFSPYL